MIPIKLTWIKLIQTGQAEMSVSEMNQTDMNQTDSYLTDADKTNVDKLISIIKLTNKTDPI